MAAEVMMGGDGTLFVGEDKTCRLELLDAAGVPVDMSGWTVAFIVKNRRAEELINEAAAISGTYDEDRAANTQRAVVTLTDDDLTIAAGTHHQSWKRTDPNHETILAYGQFIPQSATQE